MWGALIGLIGSFASGAIANQGIDKATGAQTEAAQAALAEQSRQFDAMMQLMAPSMASEYGRRAVADAFLGIPSAYSGTINIPGFGAAAGNYAGNANGAGPDGSLPEPIAEGNGGLPSLSGMITGHDPSLYNALMTGNISNESWWAEGGPSMGAQALSKMLGIRGKGDGGAPPSEWGEQVAGAQQDLDYGGYVDRHNDLLSAFNNLSDRDAGYIMRTPGIDANGDGRLDKTEYGRWHWSVHEKGGTVSDRAAPQAPGAAMSTQPAGGAGQPMQTQQASTGTGGGISFDIPEVSQEQAIDMWKASPFYTSEMAGFGKDAEAIIGANAAYGKVLSGASAEELEDRGAYRASQSAGNFYNALLGQPTQPSTDYAARATMQQGGATANNLLNLGNIQSNALLAKNDNWMKSINNAAQGIGSWFGGQS